MRKSLSRILGIALIAALSVGGANAQTLKKAKAPATKPSVAMMKAQPASAKKQAKKNLVLNATGKRSLQAASPFAKSLSSKAAIKKQTPRKAPAYAAAGIPEIQGGVVFSDAWSEAYQPVGLYNLPRAEGQEFDEVWVCPPEGTIGTSAVVDDGMYYTTEFFSFFGMVFITCYVYDLESGELVATTSPADLDVIPVGGLDKDPVTGKIYGYFYNADGTDIEFGTIEYSEDGPVRTGTISGGTGELTPCALSIDKDGVIYMIARTVGADAEGNTYTINSTLYKVDPATGDLTAVGETGELPYYVSGSCIDRKSNRMFWAVAPQEGGGYLTEVDLATGAATLVCNFVDGEEVVGMFIPAPAAEAGAPAAVENVDVNFAGGSLTGEVTFTAPSTLYDGTAATGDLTYTVLANGEEVATGSTTFGANVVAPVTLEEAGLYTFTVYVTNEVGKGPEVKVKKVWVGNDTPEATSASLVYANGNMEVSWNEVTGSINGGYIGEVTYTVTRYEGDNEGIEVATGLTSTFFTEAIAEPETLTTYYYSVVAVANDVKSAVALTNSVTLGSASLPYEADWAEGMAGWSVIDANGDGRTWQPYVSAGQSRVMRIQYNGSMDMDDWLISVPLKLEAGKKYLVSFDTYANGSTFPERIEVKYGQEPTVEGLNQTLLPATVLENGSDAPLHVSEFITPETSGKYYVGFHGISDADMFYLYMANFEVLAGVSGAAPAAPTDFTVTPDENGDLAARVSLKAPTKTLNGDDLTSLTKLELSRDGEVVKTFDAPAVGAELSFDDVLEEGGVVNYTAVAYNEAGNGEVAMASAFIGIDLPSAPTVANITRSENVGEVVVSWDAVTADVHGNNIPASKISYKVFKNESGVWEEIASDITELSYSFQAVEDGSQDFVQCLVAAETSAGEGEGLPTDMIPVGTPYVGFDEGVTGEGLNYIWGVSGSSEWGIYTDASFEGITSQNGDNGYFGCQSAYLEQVGELMSGLITIEGVENPALTFYTYVIANDDTNPIQVLVKEDGSDEWVEVFNKTVIEIAGNSDSNVNTWVKASANLGAYNGKTIQFMLRSVCAGYAYLFIDNIKIDSMLAHDVAAASISAPAVVNAGADYKVTVSVANEGAQEAQNVSVALYANEELVETKDIESMASGEYKSVEFDRTMSAIATEAVPYFAVVAMDGDENSTNNQSDLIEVAPKESALPAATDLTGSVEGSDVTLTWTEPNLEAAPGEPITEDFEDGDAYSAEFGNWIFVDVDDSEVGGFQGTDLPGITPGGTKGSFWIWDQGAGLGNQTFDAHSGMKYLFALFRYDDGTTDDWAITPELGGTAQTITFYAKSYSASYPEKIECYYSTGSTDVNDFVKIEGAGANVVPSEWTLYSAEVPEGAKRFAIRSCATGSFMLMVDDVTYILAGATQDAEILGYNVYRDGVQINDALVEETSYVDAGVADGEHSYVVVTVFNKGASKPSNAITLEVSGITDMVKGGLSVKAVDHSIVVKNAESVLISNMSGAIIYKGQGDAKVPVASGVYVVKADNKSVKVIVK